MRRVMMILKIKVEYSLLFPAADEIYELYRSKEKDTRGKPVVSYLSSVMFDWSCRNEMTRLGMLQRWKPTPEIITFSWQELFSQEPFWLVLLLVP